MLKTKTKTNKNKTALQESTAPAVKREKFAKNKKDTSKERLPCDLLTFLELYLKRFKHLRSRQ